MASSVPILEDIRGRARTFQQTIVLAEAHDDRVLQAADFVLKEHLVAELVLLGPEEKTGIAPTNWP